MPPCVPICEDQDTNQTLAEIICMIPTRLGGGVGVGVVAVVLVVAGAKSSTGIAIIFISSHMKMCIDIINIILSGQTATLAAVGNKYRLLRSTVGMGSKFALACL